MRKVLFICISNIFRSQIAEAYFNYLTHSDRAKSAGLDPQDAIPEEVVEAMEEVGVELDGTPKGVSQELLDEADLIVALDKRVPKSIPSTYAKKTVVWDTPDTSPQYVDRIREIRDMIIRRVEELVKKAK